jgi:hypothetical protein
MTRTDLAEKIYVRVISERISNMGKTAELKPEAAARLAKMSIDAAGVFDESLNAPEKPAAVETQPDAHSNPQEE